MVFVTYEVIGWQTVKKLSGGDGVLDRRHLELVLDGHPNLGELWRWQNQNKSFHVDQTKPSNQASQLNIWRVGFRYNENGFRIRSRVQ